MTDQQTNRRTRGIMGFYTSNNALKDFRLTLQLLRNCNIKENMATYLTSNDAVIFYASSNVLLESPCSHTGHKGILHPHAWTLYAASDDWK